MKKSKYILSVLFSIAFIASANAREVNVEANGIGGNYDWAVLNALENAARQNSTVYVYKNAPLSFVTADDSILTKYKDGKTVESVYSEIQTIETFYKGKIKSYKVTKMEEKDNFVYVTVNAVIDVPEEKKVTIVETVIAKPERTLAVMPFKGLKNYSCGKESVSLDTINKNLISSLNKKIYNTHKFSIVTRDDLYGYSEDTINDVSADYMVVGTINEFQSSTNTKTVDVTGESYTKSFAKMVVNYSLIDTATSEVIFSDSAEASINKEGQTSSCANILKKLTNQIGTSVSKDTLNTVFPNYEYVEPISKVEAVDNIDNTNNIVRKTVTTTTTQTREVVR